VVLWGFTAIIGKLIALPALTLVWWRMVLVTASLLVIKNVWTGLRSIPLRLRAIYAGIGILVAVHWLTFYGSIKLSNASVAATCLALSPVFMAFIEPLISRQRFDAWKLLSGLAVIPGVFFVVGGTPAGMRSGIVVGAISAVFVAAFSSLNKRFAGDSDALSVTGIEMGAGALFVTAIGPLFLRGPEFFVLPTPADAVLLIALALGCTLLPFALSLVALRRLSAFTVVLALNMEPVYTVLLAIVLLGEQRELDPSFYVGVAIIVVVVFSYPLLAANRLPRPVTGAAGAGRPDRDTNDSA
jgi:drug/metabolite transporter (DMT)-like permease